MYLQKFTGLDYTSKKHLPTLIIFQLIRPPSYKFIGLTFSNRSLDNASVENKAYTKEICEQLLGPPKLESQTGGITIPKKKTGGLFFFF